jgi:hypothetical protein
MHTIGTIILNTIQYAVEIAHMSRGCSGTLFNLLGGIFRTRTGSWRGRSVDIDQSQFGTISITYEWLSHTCEELSCDIDG